MSDTSSSNTDIYDVIYKNKPISDQEKGVPEVVPFLGAWKRTARNLRMFEISLGLSNFLLYIDYNIDWS